MPALRWPCRQSNSVLYVLRQYWQLRKRCISFRILSKNHLWHTYFHHCMILLWKHGLGQCSNVVVTLIRTMALRFDIILYRSWFWVKKVRIRVVTRQLATLSFNTPAWFKINGYSWSKINSQVSSEIVNYYYSRLVVASLSHRIVHIVIRA